MILLTCTPKEKRISYISKTELKKELHLSEKDSVPMQFPKAGQWWSNPLMFALHLLQYLTLENTGIF